MHPRQGGRSPAILGEQQGPLNWHPSQEDFSVEFHKEAHDEGSWKPQLFKR